jgi:hypothetical protein
MRGNQKQHHNIDGRMCILDIDTELGDFVLNEFLNGEDSVGIAKLVKIRFPDKKISPLTIRRWLDKKIDLIDPDNQDSDKTTQAVIGAFDFSIKSFNKLFDEIKAEVDLTSSQQKKLENLQRSINSEFGKSKRQFKIYQLSLKIANQEIQDTLEKFLNTLTGTQRSKLGEMVEDLIPDDFLINNSDKKKYDKYVKKKTKAFYDCFPVDNGDLGYQ